MSEITDSLGNLTIINATPFTWHRSLEQSYQMPTWSFPETIDSGTMVSVPIGFGFLGTATDDAGEVNYTVTGQENFQIQARVHSGSSGSDLLIDYGQISSIGNPLGSTIDLDFWASNDEAFILSGSDITSFSSSNPPTNWMHQNLPTIGCQPLRHLCMPASHDAGMSVLNGNTLAANDLDTLTQYTDIAGQLSAGFRYFDIRPVIHDGQFYTGHYSEIAGSWQGGNGQSIASVINQVNTFLSNNHELVILDLTHAYDTDSNYAPLTSAQTTQLTQQLLGLNNRFVAPAGTPDLSQLSLNTFIATSPAVMVVFDDNTLSPTTYPAGFYNTSTFTVYNSYADSADVSTMVANQLSKMSTQRPTPDSGLFLLSWTLTTLDPREAAPAAHAELFQRLWPAMMSSNGKKTFPNFIMVDAIGQSDSADNLGNGNVAALAMAVNHWFNDGCSS